MLIKSLEDSWDFNLNSPVKRPDEEIDNHGTRCAGQIVGKPNNNICGVGVAFGAMISSIRLISQNPSDYTEANALGYKIDNNHIFTNSWGVNIYSHYKPEDNGKTMDGPGSLTSMAIQHAIKFGRQGKVEYIL
jgi:hypothetical protein